MGSHDLEHISTILYRVVEALTEEWKQQRDEKEVEHEKKRRVLQFDPKSQRYFDNEF